MSDRIAVMHAGEVEQLGTPEELYERPATRFVADFIGTTNLLHGMVQPDASVRLATGEVAPVVHNGLAAGSEVELGVRPDDLVITTFNAGVGSSTLPIYIYSKIRFGVTPEINAISTITVAVTAIAILLA